MVTRSSPRYRSLVKVVACLFFATLLGQLNMGKVGAYNCMPNNNHCYGLYRWVGATTGGATQITLGNLYNNDMTVLNGFIVNTMWIISTQDTSYACNAIGQCGCVNNGNRCWAEAGYIYDSPWVITSPRRGALFYYHADVTPGNGYRNHYDLPPVAANEIGGTLYVVIEQEFSGNQSFLLTLYHPNGVNTVQSEQANLNNAVPIFPAYYMDIGLELSGTATGHAPEQVFNHNQWMSQDHALHYQTLYGTSGPSVRTPPVNAWFEPLPPPFGSSATGGTWHTKCCN